MMSVDLSDAHAFLISLSLSCFQLAIFRFQLWRVPMRVPVTEANSRSLFYRICAISQASSPDAIADHSVFGFVCVEEVKVGAFVTVISPSAELPPSGILLLTETQYMDPTPPSSKWKPPVSRKRFWKNL